MTARLRTDVAIGALLRRVAAEGGFAAVLAKGDPDTGTTLLVVEDRGRDRHMLEPGFDAAGRPVPVRTGPADGDEAAIARYWQRRRSFDPDLWVVEVNVAAAERFAAETIWAR